MSMIEDNSDYQYLGVRNDRTTQSIEAGSDSEAIDSDCEEENKHPNDIRGGEIEIEIYIEKGNDVDCVDSKRIKRSPICPPTLRDLMILDDKDIDQTFFSCATHVDNNQPSTKQGMISRTRQKTVSESKWKKTIEDCIAKVTNSSSGKNQQQQADSDVEDILCETDVRGILRWEHEKKRGAIKERRWATSSSCICCCLVGTQKNIKDRKLQPELEEYLYNYVW